MNRVAIYLIRLTVILIGYAAAALAASAFIHLMFVGWVGTHGDEALPQVKTALIFSVPAIALLIAWFGFVPAALAIVLGEALGKRDWLFYALAGGVVAFVSMGLAWHAGDAGFLTTQTPSVLAVIGSGLVGGVFYWLCAGRLAGGWRSPKDPAPPTSREPSGS